jgi:RNA polymerase sigma factor (TIGR02999 family)
MGRRLLHGYLGRPRDPTYDSPAGCDRDMSLPIDDLRLLVEAWNAGDRAALDSIVELLYDDLHALAHRHLDHEQTGHTLNTTALVNEVYVRLAGSPSGAWQGRGAFFGLLSRVMRHVLVDYARARRATKRGGRHVHVTLDVNAHAADESRVDVIEIDHALDRLAERDERLAKLVECRFFGGLSDAEIAQVLDVSERTVNRDWKRARGYLSQMLTVQGS